jgi:hypothetical protein
MNLHENIQKIKDNPETSSFGKKWTIEEEKQLITYINENKSIDDIAKEHKRTSGGIRSHIREIAVRMIRNDGKTIEEVCEILHVTPEEITDAQNRRKDKKIETEMDILKDIREILIRLETKLSLT